MPRHKKNEVGKRGHRAKKKTTGSWDMVHREKGKRVEEGKAKA